MFNVQRFFLLTVGFLFFMLGCGPDGNDILRPTDILDWLNQGARDDNPASSESEMEVPLDTLDTASNTAQRVSFDQDLLPILTARCAFAGCHDANGPYGIDFRTYQTFIRSAEDEDVFVPGNARSSDIIEEVVSGRMPPGGPPLPAAQIQLFKDWINQQDPADFPNIRYDDDDYPDGYDDDEEDDDEEDDDEEDDDEDDEDDEDDD